MEGRNSFGRASSCEMSGPGQEIFSHHAVCYVPPDSDDSVQFSGTLSIVAYNFGKCIEWKQNEVSEVTDGQEQEWAVVSTTRARTLSGSNDSSINRWFPVKIPIHEIKSYRASKKKTQLTFLHRDRITKSIFIFQLENADCFTRSLRTIVKTRRSNRDKHTYNIIEERPDPQTLNRSFSELNLFTDQKDAVWKFVNDLKTRPVETTLTTFSKFSEYLLYRTPESHPIDEVAQQFLNGTLGVQSNSTEFPSIEPTTNENLEDFHVVGKREQLPPRVLVPRGAPLSLQQWNSALDSEGRVVDVAGIKKIIFEGGIDPKLRYEVWKFLLGYYPWNSTASERTELRKAKVEEYFRMKLQWKSLSPDQESRFTLFREHKSLIEKDVNRTDRTIEFYSGENNPNLSVLYDVLMTYVMYNFDLGYVQGMSDLLSPILSLMTNEVESFWCFVGFMNKVHRNFDVDQSGMKKQLSQLHTLLTAVEPNLATYLDEHDSGNMFFCFRWLLVWFKREFQHHEIMVLWEVLWTGLPCSNFHLVLCAAILENEKNVLMENNFGFTEILKHINDLSCKMGLDDTLIRATAIYKQLESASNLTMATRRVLGLASGSSTLSTSSDDDSVSDDTPCDMVPTAPELLEKQCDTAMNLNYI